MKQAIIDGSVRKELHHSSGSNYMEFDLPVLAQSNNRMVKFDMYEQASLRNMSNEVYLVSSWHKSAMMVYWRFNEDCSQDTSSQSNGREGHLFLLQTVQGYAVRSNRDVADEKLVAVAELTGYLEETGNSAEVKTTSWSQIYAIHVAEVRKGAWLQKDEPDVIVCSHDQATEKLRCVVMEAWQNAIGRYTDTTAFMTEQAISALIPASI